jgi:hypothetical protein
MLKSGAGTRCCANETAKRKSAPWSRSQVIQLRQGTGHGYKLSSQELSAISMSVRVVARIRPLLRSENERDQIVSSHGGADNKPSIIKIPNPKNFAEEYSFQFNSVYEQESTQQDLFETEGPRLYSSYWEYC